MSTALFVLAIPIYFIAAIGILVKGIAKGLKEKFTK